MSPAQSGWQEDQQERALGDDHDCGKKFARAGVQDAGDAQHLTCTGDPDLAAGRLMWDWSTSSLGHPGVHAEARTTT